MDLDDLCRDVLTSGLPASLKSAIRPFLRRYGRSGTEYVLWIAKRKKSAPLTLLAIEAFCEEELKRMTEAQ